MTNEQLIFNAGNAAHNAERLLKELWSAPQLSLQLLRDLKQHALTLHCAAVELENRAVGNQPPREGGE